MRYQSAFTNELLVVKPRGVSGIVGVRATIPSLQYDAVLTIVTDEHILHKIRCQHKLSHHNKFTVSEKSNGAKLA